MSCFGLLVFVIELKALRNPLCACHKSQMSEIVDKEAIVILDLLT